MQRAAWSRSGEVVGKLRPFAFPRDGGWSTGVHFSATGTEQKGRVHGTEQRRGRRQKFFEKSDTTGWGRRSYVCEGSAGAQRRFGELAMDTNFAATILSPRWSAIAAITGIAVSVVMACCMAAGTMPDESHAFAPYLDPLPRPIVPFCPDCLGGPVTVNPPKVNVPSSLAPRVPALPKPPAPSSIAGVFGVN